MEALVAAIRATDDPDIAYTFAKYLTHTTFIALGLRN
jgi:hypothetical protein